MTAKRNPLRRRRRFQPNGVALFARLDAIPRERKAYSDGSRQLAGLLGLESEWLTGNSPLDRSRRPHRQPGCCAYTDWHTCRAVREELLEAVQRRTLPE
jgi:hypothetical protein